MHAFIYRFLDRFYTHSFCVWLGPGLPRSHDLPLRDSVCTPVPCCHLLDFEPLKTIGASVTHVWVWYPRTGVAMGKEQIVQLWAGCGFHPLGSNRWQQICIWAQFFLHTHDLGDVSCETWKMVWLAAGFSWRVCVCFCCFEVQNKTTKLVKLIKVA